MYVKLNFLYVVDNHKKKEEWKKKLLDFYITDGKVSAKLYFFRKMKVRERIRSLFPLHRFPFYDDTFE